MTTVVAIYTGHGVVDALRALIKEYLPDVRLYNIVDDIGEQIDLVDGQEELVENMRTKLWHWLETTNAKFPEKDIEYVAAKRDSVWAFRITSMSRGEGRAPFLMACPPRFGAADLSGRASGMVLATPASTAPRNSNTAATTMACLIVSALDPTDVAIALATSLAPMPQAMNRPNSAARTM